MILVNALILKFVCHICESKYVTFCPEMTKWYLLNHQSPLQKISNISVLTDLSHETQHLSDVKSFELFLQL